MRYPVIVIPCSDMRLLCARDGLLGMDGFQVIEGLKEIEKDSCKYGQYWKTNTHLKNNGGDMSVKWQKEFATGVVEIDLQHRELFSKLDDLLNAIESGMGRKVLSEFHGFLDSYTRKHFTAEEALQLKFKYPHMATHCEEHNTFIKKLDYLKCRTEEDGPSDAVVKLTRNTLVSWLIQHICFTDRHLGDFVKVHRNIQWEEWMRSQF